MFMKFDLFGGGYHPDDYEPPVGARDALPQQKICLNIKNIDIVQQSGQYRELPVEPRAGEVVPDEALDARGLARPGLARPARQQRRRQVFVVDGDRFIITLNNGHNYTVMGRFDEFCEILTNFREKLETV